MNKFIATFAAVCLTSTAALAQGAASKPGDAPASISTGSTGTLRFVTNAQAGTHFEIEDSQLALKQAQSQEVKDFASQMVKDHTEWAKMLSDAIKSDKKTVLPDDTPMMADHTAMINQLRSLAGAEFDKAYVQHMVTAHQNDFRAFTDYSTNGDDPVVQGVSQKILPGIKRHLDMITKIQKGGPSGGI